MNEEQRIRKLARRARMETQPKVEVADRVMTILRAGRHRTQPELGPLVWVAGVAAAAAVPLAVAAVIAWQTLADPLVAAFVEPPWGLL